MGKYIQSFYQYPLTFSSIGRTVPARGAAGDMRNIAEVSDAELERLEKCEPRFRELVRLKKYRVLSKIPQSYVPPAQQVNEARSEADALRAENDALKARLAELEKAAEKSAEKKTAEKPKAEKTKSAEKPSEEKPSEEKKE